MNTIQKTAAMLGMLGAVLSSSAEALELKDLHLPMTRNEADGSLSKDYDFTILSDSTVRRTWKLKGRTVHVDFKLNNKGQALCIAVEYAKPTGRKTVHNDIKAVTGGKSNYKKLGKPTKKTNTYGMEHALGGKVKSADGKGEGWIFVEHSSAARKKCTRFVYYASKPSRDRLSIGAAREDSGYTAMGSSGSNIDLSALVADEEDRRRTSPAAAKPDKKRPVLADTPEEPVAPATSSDDEFSAPEAVADWEDESAEEESTATKAPGKGFLPENISAPVRKLLGLSPMVTDVLIVLVPLLLLLIVWRVWAAKRRKKALKMAYESILNKKAEQKPKDAE